MSNYKSDVWKAQDRAKEGMELLERCRAWFTDQPLDRDDSEDGRVAEELLEKLDNFLGPIQEED